MPLISTVGLVKATVLGGAIAAGAEASDGVDLVSLLGTTVTPVAVVLLLVTGQLVTKGERDRLAAQIEAEREDRKTLQKVLTDDIGPALIRSTDAVTRSTDLMEAMARRQARGV